MKQEKQQYVSKITMEQFKKKKYIFISVCILEYFMQKWAQ